MKTWKTALSILFVSVFIKTANAQYLSTDFFVNDALKISRETLDSLHVMGFDTTSYAIDFDTSTLGDINFPAGYTVIDFNQDGYQDIVFLMALNPSIGSAYSIFLYDQQEKIFKEDPKWFFFQPGDSYFFFDTVFDMNKDGLLDIYTPAQNFHGNDEVKPSYYLNGDQMPGMLFLNTGDGFRSSFIDTTTRNIAQGKGYLDFTSGFLIDYDADNKKDLVVPLFDRHPENNISSPNKYLLTDYDVNMDDTIESKFVIDIPWSPASQTKIDYFREYEDKIYYLGVIETPIEYPVITTDYPFIIEFQRDSLNKSLNYIKTINLEADPALLYHNSPVNRLNFFITDIEKDGSDEFILQLRDNSEQLEYRHGIHVFDTTGQEVTTNYFLNLDYVDTRNDPANGINVVDLNGDGYDDIMPHSSYYTDEYNLLPVFMNNGVSFTKMYIEVNDELLWRIPIDVDNDGKFEILSGHNRVENGSTVQIYQTVNHIDYSGTIVSVDQLDQVRKFHLEQNYPNPFNPSTMIRYTLPEATQVRVEVFNLLGQSVGMLVDGVQQAGSHTVNFDASGLTTGVYFYRLVTPQYSETRQMMLIK